MPFGVCTQLTSTLYRKIRQILEFQNLKRSYRLSYTIYEHLSNNMGKYFFQQTVNDRKWCHLTVNHGTITDSGTI